MADATNATKAFAALRTFLEAEGFGPQEIPGKHIYAMNVQGRNGTFACYAEIKLELEQFVFYVMAPLKAPPERRGELTEFFTRANYGLRIGNFEMDMQDGEMRFKSSVDFEGTELSPRLISNAVYPAAHTMDRYFPGLMAVVDGKASARQAVRIAEGQ